MQRIPVQQLSVVAILDDFLHSKKIPGDVNHVPFFAKTGRKVDGITENHGYQSSNREPSSPGRAHPEEHRGHEQKGILENARKHERRKNRCKNSAKNASESHPYVVPGQMPRVWTTCRQGCVT